MKGDPSELDPRTALLYELLAGEGGFRGDLELLAEEAAAQGLSMERFEASPREIEALPADAFPLVTRFGPEGSERSWALLLPSAGGGLELQRGPGESAPLAVGASELAATLAAEIGLAEEQRVTWARLSTRRRVEGRGIQGGAGRPSASAKGGERPPPLRRLFRLLRPDRSDLLAVVAFAVAIGVLLLATPIAVQALVNSVALGGAIQPLIVVAGLLFLGLCFAGLLGALQSWVVEILQRRIFVRSVAQLAERLPRAALGESRTYGAELVNRFFDLVTIQKVGSFLLLDGLSVLLSVLVGLVVLAFYHPFLLAFDIVLLVVIAGIVLGPVRRGIRSAREESTAKYGVVAWLEEIAHNPVVFKSSGAGRAVLERCESLTRTYVDRRAAHFRVVFGQGIAALTLQVLASTALLTIGGLLVIRGSLTLGQLVASELILTLVVSSVAKMGKHIEAFYDLMAATDKLGILLDVQQEHVEGELVPVGDPAGIALELRSVSWGPKGAPDLFAGVSLEIEPREVVALAGPSGAGKSLLLQIVWALRQPRRGVVRIDGRDTRELALESLRRAVALVEGFEVFEGTVKENVTLGRPFVTDDEAHRALELVGLAGELERLEGANTHLGVSGAPLSTGQLVRLAVARAIAGRPRLLLVSDVFERLDDDERERLIDLVAGDGRAWSALIVTNDERVQRRCARTARLAGGVLTIPADRASA